MGLWLLTDNKRAVAAFLTLLMTVGLSGCSDENKPRHSDPEYALLSELYNRFDPERPGFGVADYPGHQAVHIPKAHAAIVLAEVERERHGMMPSLPNLAKTSGQWLLDNNDIDGDGVVGWGVPIAWDAYGDGSENPADTVYTISTAIVVDALLTWMERDPSSPKAEIFDTVKAALQSFVDPRMRSTSGMIPYSFRDSDLIYDTFNPAAYMAGQLQRFSLLTDDTRLREALQTVADDTVRVLLKEHKVNQVTGSWYWNYSIQENVANDLPHASYIIEGLLKYRLYGGRLSDAIDINATLVHLREFADDKAGYVRAWPKLQENIDRPARTYDLGMALALACSVPDLADLSDVFAAEISKYRDKDGFLKYPKDSNITDPLVVNEYEAYLYWGVMGCTLYNEQLVPSDATLGLSLPHHAFGSALGYVSTESAKRTVVPFVSPAHNTSSNVEIGGALPFNMRLTDRGSQDISFPEGELPLASHNYADGRAIFIRSMTDNELSIALADKTGSVITRLPIRHDPGSKPMFRASSVMDGEIYLVYYDNISLNNYLVRYALNGQRITQVGEVIKLPLLQDPAGGTYEMIPAVFLMPLDTGEMAVVGGTLSGRFSPKTGFSEGRIENCMRALEAVVASGGPVVLCQAKDVAAGQSDFLLSGPDDVSMPTLGQASVPFSLSVQNGRVKVDFATDPQSHARMLRFDLERIQQNGWMEFGVNNEEGRIPWSQIYYLNGMMDFLLIAEGESTFREEFADLLADMRTRLDMEMLLVDWHWREGRYQTRGFTVDRSPAIFAVQTSRLLLLMDRYRSEMPHPLSLPGYESVRQATHCLDRHIDVLQYGGEPLFWMKPNNASLRWPKGSAFYFDGLAVPYNHQNEWAYAINRTQSVSSCEKVKAAGYDIINHFMRHVAPMGVYPNNGVWSYWWGTAYDGWTIEDGISVNKPSYTGDKIKAWISFRTIDLMGVLSYLRSFDPLVQKQLLTSVRHQIYNGNVYPFANYELLKQGGEPLLAPSVARKYVRVSSPWELQNAAWAYLVRLVK